MGTFDLFHHGHQRLLERAAEFGGLTVGVNSDDFVIGYKGQAPAMPESERLKAVASSRHVKNAYLNTDPHALIVQLRPDLIVVGSDWHEHGYLAQIQTPQAELDELGVGVVYLPRTPGISSTKLRSTGELDRRD